MGGFLSKSKKLERGSSGRSSGKNKSKKEKNKSSNRRSTIGSSEDIAPQQRSSTVSVKRRRSFGSSLFKSNSDKGKALSRASEIPVRKRFVIDDETSLKEDNKEDNKTIYAEPIDSIKDVVTPPSKVKGQVGVSEELNQLNKTLNEELKSFKPLKHVSNTSLDRTRRKSVSSSRLSINSKKDRSAGSLNSYEMPKDYVSVSSNRLNHVSNLQDMKQELRTSIQNVIESMKPAEVKCVPIQRETVYYDSSPFTANVKKRSLGKHVLRPVSNIYDSFSYSSSIVPPPDKMTPAKSIEVVHRRESFDRNSSFDTTSKYYDCDEIAYAIVNISDIKDPEDIRNDIKNQPVMKIVENQNSAKHEEPYVNVNERPYVNINTPLLTNIVAAETKKEEPIQSTAQTVSKVVIKTKTLPVINKIEKNIQEEIKRKTERKITEKVEKPSESMMALPDPVNASTSNKEEDTDIKEENVSSDEITQQVASNKFWGPNDIYSEDSLDELSDSSDDEDVSWTYKNFNNLISQAGRSRAPVVFEEEDSDSSVEYVSDVDIKEAKEIEANSAHKKSGLTRNRGNVDRPTKWVTKEQADIYKRDCQQNGPTAPYTGYVIPRVKPVYSSKKHRREDHHQHPQNTYSGEESVDHDDWSPERGLDKSEQGSVKDKAKVFEKKGMIMGPADQGRIKDRIVGSSPPRGPHSPHRLPDPRLQQLEFRSNANFDGSRPHRVKSLGPMKSERLALNAKDILHCGNVRVVKKAENGIKIPKLWHDNFLILKNGKLEFYESEKAWRDQHLHRFDILLKNGLVDLENVKKRIKIVDANNDMYVTEHPNEREAKDWMARIRNNALVVASDSQPSPIASPSPTMARHRTKSTSKAASDESVNDISSAGDSQENIPKNTKSTSKILDKWLRKRPQKDTLINKGIYQDEAVFGRNLSEVCPPERPRIPEFVVRCVKVIESNIQNMTTDGIYRASGNLSQIQKIRLDVNQKNLSVVNDTVDVHVLTGALKLFFRELKEPLIPFEFFQKALNASCKQDHDSRVKEFREIVKRLPDCNKDTLTFFLEHLLNVTNYEDKNRMKVSNLAIVLGPTILWAPPNATQNLALDFLKQNEVIEYLLNDYKLIFQDDQKKFETKM